MRYIIRSTNKKTSVNKGYIELSPSQEFLNVKIIAAKGYCLERRARLRRIVEALRMCLEVEGYTIHKVVKESSRLEDQDGGRGKEEEQN